MTHTIDRKAVLVGPRQVAAMYGVTHRQVHYALHRGLIRGRLAAGVWMIDVRDLPDVWPVKTKRPVAA